MYKRVTVGLRHDVYAKLKDRGRFGESFSDLVSRLIDEVELTKVIHYLDKQIDDIGKTEHSKHKPYGLFIQKQKQIQEI